MANFKFIDLFCGIGAFHQAMKSLGGECVYACDIDKDCRKTYEKNYGIVPDSDITKVQSEDIPKFDVLCAGFPCVSFSKAGNRLGFSDPTRGTLFFDVVRIAKYHMPKYILLENVRNLASHDNGNTWKVIYDTLCNMGYNLQKTPCLFSPHYIGIPQHRERVFIMAVRKDIGDIPEFCFNKNNIVQCSIDSVLQDDSEIENLEHYQLHEEKIEWIELWNKFIRNVRYNSSLPSFPVWGTILRICKTQNLEFDFWTREQWSYEPKWKRDFINRNIELYKQNQQFISRWLYDADKCPLFDGTKMNFEWQAGVDAENPDIWDNIMQIRPSGLRVKPGTYFPALVAMNQTSIVGKRKRILIPRECARIQSFPDDFVYDDKEAQAYKQFGNSINVECAKLFAKFMLGDEETRRKYSREVQFPDELISNKLF